LLIGRGGIVHGEKDLEHLAQRDPAVVELHPHDLGMPGIAFTDLLVARLLDVPVAVA
jgi:hypothetical protein